MSTLDLEKMQGKWRQHSQRVEASLTLDVEGVRNRLKLGTRSAFNRHLRWLKLEIAFGAATLLALLAFVMAERTDLVYLAASVPLLALVLFAFGTDIRHWQILSKLNLNAPIMQVRAVLDAVRKRRLLVVKWIVLSGCLLWLPVVAVLLKAAFGLDLLRGLHVSVVAVNVVFGVLLIPIGLVIFGWFTKRFADAPAFQRFVESASGTSFSAARSNFELEADFAESLDRNPPAAILQQQQSQWPAHANALLRQFRIILMFGISLCIVLVLSLAGFNVTHGGNAHALIPGIFLHLFLVMHMVAGIVHRQLLGNLGAGCAQPLAAQIQSLQQMALWRGNLARLSIVLSPVLALALAQVLAKAIYAIDLYQAASAGLGISAVGGALLLSVVLYLRWRATATCFAQHSSNALSFGALKMTQRLFAALSHDSA